MFNEDPMLPLSRKPEGNAQAESDPASTPMIAIDGRVVLEHRAFVAHGFETEEERIANFFIGIFEEMHIRCTSGERAEAGPISEKVKKRIIAAEWFVGIFTRRDRIDGTDEWRSPDWLSQELAFAVANEKRLLLLKEENVRKLDGLQGDYEYVPFSRDALHKSVRKVLQMVWSLNPGMIKLGTSGAPQISLSLIQAAIAAAPSEPSPRLMLAQYKEQSGQYDAARHEVDQVLEKYPNFPQALVHKAKILRNLGQKKESQAIVESLLSSFPNHPEAHHQLAHLLEDQGDIEKASSEFEAAANCAPGNSQHYWCHAQMLFRLAGSDVAKLNAACELFKIAENRKPKLSTHLVPYYSEIERRSKQK